MASVRSPRLRLWRNVRGWVLLAAVLAGGLSASGASASIRPASAAASFCKRISTASLSSDFGTSVKLLATGTSGLGEYVCAFGKTLTQQASQVGAGYNPRTPGTVAQRLAEVRHELGGFADKTYASIGGPTFSWTATVTGVKESGMVSFNGSREYSVMVNKRLAPATLAKMLKLVVAAA